MIFLLIIGLVVVVSGCMIGVWLEQKALGIIIVILGLVTEILGASVKFVPSGYVGIRTSYGQISDKPVNQGQNWHVPFIERIYLVNCKQQEKDFKELQIWSETSERTEVYCQQVVVDYQINAEDAAWIWQNVEEYDTNLVKQTSVESGIKAATKQFSDIDVTDRAKIEGAAKDAIQKALNTKYGKQIVNVVSVTIGNINFSDAYNEAIEKKAQAKLAAEAAEYSNKQVTQQVQAEAEQQKIKAEADAEAKKIKAEAEAESITIQAEAEAKANKMIAESLTPELIDKAAETIVEAAKRTDAKVSGPIPLPTKTEIVTILRAVHKYKDSREQFERRTHKRLIDIMSPTQKTVEALMNVEVPAGVEIEIKL